LTSSGIEQPETRKQSSGAAIHGLNPALSSPGRRLARITALLHQVAEGLEQNCPGENPSGEKPPSFATRTYPEPDWSESKQTG
jgi:hypothetical protein